MSRAPFDQTLCPVARTLERVGDPWSLLILRDATQGLTRFEQFRTSLGVAPNILTDRLRRLVVADLLERRRYSEHPPRDEYVLTAMGRDFTSVLLALMAFGNRHFAKEGVASQLIDTTTGRPADPVLVDANNGRRLDGPGFAFAAGPAADAGVLATVARLARHAEPVHAS
jgi:DNA-binding HxlR family transcriptional regulator